MIIVMGLPGAGKTTILNNLDTEYKIVNYGDLMLEIEKEEYGIEDRDEMRKISTQKQERAQRLVYERLSEMSDKVILDTHCAINTPEGFLPGLPFEYLKTLDVDSLVLVTATVEEVRERREKDKSRDRDNDNIKLHDDMNKAFLASYSGLTGAPAKIIHNKDGKLQEAVKELETILEKY